VGKLAAPTRLLLLEAMPSFFQNLFKRETDTVDAEMPQEPDSGIHEPTSLLSAMNLPSPFAVSAEERFTVRELSILLPPQFVKTDGLSADQPVNLPLDLLKLSLQQGRPALRLSQIYQACPFLLTRQVLPAEDVEIVLPFQKVKRMVEPGSAPSNGGIPFMPASAPGRAGSPFGPPAPAASPFMPAPATGQLGSPFTPARSAESPFAAARGNEAGDSPEVLSPFAPAAAPAPALAAAPVASPFQLVSPAPAEPAAALSSVFAAALPMPPPPGSPFARLASNGNGSHASLAVPAFEAPPSGGRGPSPFGLPDAPKPAAEPEPIPAPAAAAPAPATPSTIKVSLAALLRDITIEDLGFDPAAVPGSVDAELSCDTVLPQLATGRVEVSIEELRAGVIDRFRPAFARARNGLRFVVPLSEIFRSLPAEAIPAAAPVQEHIPISTSAFQTPFAIKAEEDKAGVPLPSLPPISGVAVPAPVQPLAPFPLTPPAAAESPAAPAAPKLPELPALPRLPGMAAPVGAPGSRPSPFARPPGSPAADQTPPAVAPMTPPFTPPVKLPSLGAAEQHDDLGAPFAAASLRAEPPAPQAAAPESFDAARTFNGGAAAKPAPVTQPRAATAPTPPVMKAPKAPAPKPATPAAPAMEFSFGKDESTHDLMLRALFNTEAVPTADELAQHCAALPGLRTCIVVSRTGAILGTPDAADEEVHDFNTHAPKAHEYLTGLAQSMGFGDQGSFTLRSPAVVRTFFIERHLCLAVLHGEEVFQPGVREKLILTARALAEMLE
jgi:hypothetical protein